MLSLRKVRALPDECDKVFREAIREHSTDAGVVAAMLKVAHLVEAARAADHRVAALDETVRSHFGRTAARYEALQDIMWVNPGLESGAGVEWLESGAGEQKTRFLQPPAAE